MRCVWVRAQALQICPRDPLVCNELGVLLYRNGEYSQAEQCLKHALSLVPSGALSARWEPTAVNLGHTLRKLGRYQEALDWYDTALGLCPAAPGTHAAIGFTRHLMVRHSPPSPLSKQTLLCACAPAARATRLRLSLGGRAT